MAVDSGIELEFLLDSEGVGIGFRRAQKDSSHQAVLGKDGVIGRREAGADAVFTFNAFCGGSTPITGRRYFLLF